MRMDIRTCMVEAIGRGPHPLRSARDDGRTACHSDSATLAAVQGFATSVMPHGRSVSFRVIRSLWYLQRRHSLLLCTTRVSAHYAAW